MTGDIKMNRLKIEYALIWATACVLYALYRFDVLPQGVWATDATAQYVAGSICVLMTMGMIFLSLKLFNLNGIQQKIKIGGLSVYIRWAEIRMSILAFAVFMDLTEFFATLQPLGGLCLLICLFALVFIRPSQGEFENLNAENDPVEE